MMEENKQSDPWWWPERTDEAFFGRLRKDYPEDAHLSDEALREEYDAPGKYSTTWDNTGDAYDEYEKLADAFLVLIEVCERSLDDFRHKYGAWDAEVTEVRIIKALEQIREKQDQ